MADPRLFERVIALCALSPLIGPGTVRRALKDVGADPTTATIDDYCRAVPRLEARLRCFLSEEEASRRAREVLQLRAQWVPAADSAPAVLVAGDERSGWAGRRGPPDSGSYGPASGPRDRSAEDSSRLERKVTG